MQAAPPAGAIDEDARSRLFVEDGGGVTIGGDYSVIGGLDVERVTALQTAMLGTQAIGVTPVALAEIA